MGLEACLWVIVLLANDTEITGLMWVASITAN